VYYVTLLLVYLLVDIIACLGLNLQLGLAGVQSFAFIIFQAAGAYAYALCTLGPQQAAGAGYQSYFWGGNLPFPVPFLVAIIVGAVLAAACGALILPRLRGDYEAMAFLVVSLIASGVATNQIGLLNGANGLSGIPQPLNSTLGLATTGYDWVFVGMAGVIAFGVWRFTDGSAAARGEGKRGRRAGARQGRDAGPLGGVHDRRWPGWAQWRPLGGLHHGLGAVELDLRGDVLVHHGDRGGRLR
jgi:ABC-type branched-subunit amino acid transport system permease subunit